MHADQDPAWFPQLIDCLLFDSLYVYLSFLPSVLPPSHSLLPSSPLPPSLSLSLPTPFPLRYPTPPPSLRFTLTTLAVLSLRSLFPFFVALVSFFPILVPIYIIYQDFLKILNWDGGTTGA